MRPMSRENPQNLNRTGSLSRVQLYLIIHMHTHARTHTPIHTYIHTHTHTTKHRWCRATMSKGLAQGAYCTVIILGRGSHKTVAGINTRDNSIFMEFAVASFPEEPDAEDAERKPQSATYGQDERCNEPRLADDAQLDTTQLRRTCEEEERPVLSVVSKDVIQINGLLLKYLILE